MRLRTGERSSDGEEAESSRADKHQAHAKSNQSTLYSAVITREPMSNAHCTRHDASRTQLVNSSLPLALGHLLLSCTGLVSESEPQTHCGAATRSDSDSHSGSGTGK